MMKNTFVGMMVLVGITMMMAGCSEKRAVHDVVKEDVAGSTPSVRDISVAHKMHDEYYDTDGKQTRKDNREYSYEEMEKKYGKDLLNVHGLSMYDNNE